MRMQSDLAEKLEKRRETRMRKLEDKHQRERANYLDKAESGSQADDFINVSGQLSFSNLQWIFPPLNSESLFSEKKMIFNKIENKF